MGGYGYQDSPASPAPDATQAIGTLLGGQQPASSASSGNVGEVKNVASAVKAASSGESTGAVIGKLIGLAFYGGETPAQVKKAHPIKESGNTKTIPCKDGKVFYNNVLIPRKKV